MIVIFSDDEIDVLVKKRKLLPQGWKTRVRLTPKRGHMQGHLELTGIDSDEFRLILRQSTINQLDFSAILAVKVPQSTRLFRLLRYNGRSHEHTNSIEGETFYDYHIHTSTARYQEIGAREDAYAKVTDRYSDLYGALECLRSDGNLDTPPDDQIRLFE